MLKSNEEARTELRELCREHERSYSYIARQLGKQVTWVGRRLNGTTPMLIDDYILIKGVFEKQKAA